MLLNVGSVVVLRECILRLAERNGDGVVCMRDVVEYFLVTWKVQMIYELLEFMFDMVV